MPNLVTTSTSANSLYQGGGAMTCIATDGTAFVMYYDGTEMVYRSAASPYTSWSSPTTLPSSSGNRYGASARLNTSDNSIDVVYHVGAGYPTYVPLTYNSSTHSWSAGTSSQITTTAGSGSSGEPVQILKDGSGRLWAIMNQTTTSWEAYYSTNGTTWTASITGAAMANSGAMPFGFIAGNYLVVCWGEGTNGNMTWRRVDTTGTLTSWSTAQGVQLGNAGGFGTFWNGDLYATATDGHNRGVVCWCDNAVGFGSGISAAVYTPTSDTWGSYKLLHAGGGTGKDDGPPAVASIGTDVYVFWPQYVAANSFSLQYEKWNDSTGAWDTSSTQLEASGNNIAAVQAGASSNLVGIAYIQGTASPYSIEFDTISLASSLVRSVPTTFAMSGTLTRTVTTTIPTVATRTRTVSASIASLVTSSRTVTATVATSGAPVRSVTTTIPALATLTRTVTSTIATSGASTSRSVATSIAVLKSFPRTVPTTVAAMATRTVPTTAALRGVKPMPVISHGVPAYASDATYPATNANDTNYATTWRSNAVPSTGTPQWLAYDLSSVPSGNRGSVVVNLINQLGNMYYNTNNANAVSLFQDYTLEANASAGGTGSAPTTGWTTLVTVTGNFYPQRIHSINLTGYNWLRLKVTAAGGTSPNNDVMFQMDVHDASLGNQETFLVIGDSITAESQGVHNIDNTPWNYGGYTAQVINARTNGQYWPIFIDGGNGGMTMDWADTNKVGLLANYDGMFVVIAFGTNDLNLSYQVTATGTEVTAYYTHLLNVIDYALSLGKKVIVPYIPYGTNNAGDLGYNAHQANNYVDAHLFVDRPNADIWRGADYWTFFNANTGLIRDGIHPTYLESGGARSGYEAYIDLSATWYLDNIYLGNQRTVPTSIAAASALRTVPTSLATKATLTRTVPATISATGVQRTVPSTVVALATLTRTAPTTVPALATLTRTVTATLPALQTKTRTVSASAAVLATSTRTVFTSLSASSGLTRSVPTSFSALATLARNLPTSLPVQVTFSRVVGTSLPATAGVARTVPTSLAASGALHRTVPTSISTSGMGAQRIIVTSLATLLVSVRAVAASVATGNLGARRLVATSVVASSVSTWPGSVGLTDYAIGTVKLTDGTA